MADARWVLVVKAGPGSFEDVRVFGPWRDRSKAVAASKRLAATSDEPPLWDITYIQPEHGRESLTSLLREERAAAPTPAVDGG